MRTERCLNSGVVRMLPNKKCKVSNGNFFPRKLNVNSLTTTINDKGKEVGLRFDNGPRAPDPNQSMVVEKYMGQVLNMRPTQLERHTKLSPACSNTSFKAEVFLVDIRLTTGSSNQSSEKHQQPTEDLKISKVVENNENEENLGSEGGGQSSGKISVFIKDGEIGEKVVAQNYNETEILASRSLPACRK
ncbi:hypothetical protein QYF36_015237 [Acer negundo]|nr:hypothetical protein QYF36_015237 [Acer negundo]